MNSVLTHNTGRMCCGLHGLKERIIQQDVKIYNSLIFSREKCQFNYTKMNTDKVILMYKFSTERSASVKIRGFSE